MAAEMITFDEAGRVVGVSRSTVWRLIQRLRRRGRRWIVSAAIRTRGRRNPSAQIPPFSHEHPMFGLVGAGRGGGAKPGARDKHAILDR